MPVSVGELVDKITILTLKAEYISDTQKLENIRHELDLLADATPAIVKASAEITSLTGELLEVNRKLWHIEDDIRACERQKDFGPRFVELARAVYFTNDKRAELKRSINFAAGSSIIEEKSYEAY